MSRELYFSTRYNVERDSLEDQYYEICEFSIEFIGHYYTYILQLVSDFLCLQKNPTTLGISPLPLPDPQPPYPLPLSRRGPHELSPRIASQLPLEHCTSCSQTLCVCVCVCVEKNDVIYIAGCVDIHHSVMGGGQSTIHNGSHFRPFFESSYPMRCMVSLTTLW